MIFIFGLDIIAVASELLEVGALGFYRAQKLAKYRKALAAANTKKVSAKMSTKNILMRSKENII